MDFINALQSDIFLRMLYGQIFIILRKDDENLIMHYKKGALGFLVLAIFKNVFSVFVPKNLGFFGFGVHCGLRILAFGFAFREKY